MKKISSRQALLLVVSTVFSPAVRLYSAFYSRDVNQSAWIAPLIAGAAAACFILVINGILKSGRSFSSCADFAIGTAGTKVLAAVYFVWGTLLVALHLRYYAQRITTTIYTDISIDPFIIVMVLLCFMALLSGLEAFARMNEIISMLMAFITVGVMILLSGETEKRNLLPLDDSFSIAHTALFTLASFSYITFILFFADELTEKEKFKKHGFLSVGAISLLSVWLFVTVIGSLGPELIKKLEYPFFGAVKQISVGEFIQHIEALIVTIWILSDFVIVTFISSAMLKIISYGAKTEDTKPFAFPYAVLCITLVPMMGRNDGELKMLSERIFLPANLILLFAVPLALFVIMKIKDKKRFAKPPAE